MVLYLIDVEKAVRSTFKLYVGVVNWRSIVGTQQEKS